MSKFFGFERVMKARGKMADDVPVEQCRFLEENKSGLRFRRNKIWQLTECTTPYNRPSINRRVSSHRHLRLVEQVRESV